MLSDDLQDLAATMRQIERGAARAEDGLRIDPDLFALIADNVEGYASQARCLEAGVVPVSDPETANNVVRLFPASRKGPAA